MTQPGSDEGRRQGTLSRRPHLPGRAVRRHRRGLRPAVLGGTAADRGDPAHPAPVWCTIHRCPRGPQSARRRGRPPASSRAAPPQAESTHRPVRRASRRRAAPPASQPGPKSSRKSTKRCAFCAIHPYSLSLHHHRYVDCAVGAACTASGGVAHAAQPVSLAHTHNSTRLRDSVRQATSQVQRRSRDVGGSPERPCLARGDCCPPGKGCNRAGPSSRDEAGVYSPYFIVPKKGGGLRPILDLRVLNRALHKLPFKMLTHRRMIKCIQRLTTMQWTAGPWESMISSWGSWRGMNPSRPPLVPSWDLSIVLAGLQRGPFEPLDSVELKFLSLKTALLTAFTSIKRVGDLQAFSVSEECLVFGPVYSHIVLRQWAWIRAQGSHHALPRSGGEPASTALGGGRSSLSVAVSRKSIAHIRDPHPERQNLRAALCLPRRAAEREGCLQTKVGPLDSGGRRLGVPVARRAVPPGGEGSLHQECCLLPCVGARCLFGRHLQSCGLGDTEHLRKILQSPRWASFFPCIG